jgi:hypothetical protein
MDTQASMCVYTTRRIEGGIFMLENFSLLLGAKFSFSVVFLFCFVCVFFSMRRLDSRAICRRTAHFYRLSFHTNDGSQPREEEEEEKIALSMRVVVHRE